MASASPFILFSDSQEFWKPNLKLCPVLAELATKEVQMPDMVSVIVGGDDIAAAVLYEVKG